MNISNQDENEPTEREMFEYEQDAADEMYYEYGGESEVEHCPNCRTEVYGFPDGSFMCDMCRRTWDTPGDFANNTSRAWQDWSDAVSDEMWDRLPELLLDSGSPFGSGVDSAVCALTWPHERGE